MEQRNYNMCNKIIERFVFVLFFLIVFYILIQLKIEYKKQQEQINYIENIVNDLNQF